MEDTHLVFTPRTLYLGSGDTQSARRRSHVWTTPRGTPAASSEGGGRGRVRPEILRFQEVGLGSIRLRARPSAETQWQGVPNRKDSRASRVGREGAPPPWGRTEGDEETQDSVSVSGGPTYRDPGSDPEPPIRVPHRVHRPASVCPWSVPCCLHKGRCCPRQSWVGRGPTSPLCGRCGVSFLDVPLSGLGLRCVWRDVPFFVSSLYSGGDLGHVQWV